MDDDRIAPGRIAEAGVGALGGIEIDRRLGAAPVQRQIYQRIRGAILSRALPPGARLPSSRSLAGQLSVARGTVDAAYQLLAGEGYILTRGAGGTIVDPQLGAAALVTAASGGFAERHPAAAARPLPPTIAGAPIRDHPVLDRSGAPLPFQMGMPALDAFPRKLWSRLAARRARVLPTTSLVYQDPCGLPALREAVAAYLRIARGIVCEPEQVFVTAGFQGALGLIARVLLRPGDAAWVEDPGYVLAREGLALARARLVPVPVDADGLDVAAGIARAPDARFAVVTPSHQCPLGVTLALPRRLALLSWAAAADHAWIIEDDYDSEFRYAGRPLPALRSLDAGAGRVLYVGTFSKVLFPGLRLGYLVVPEAQTDAFMRACDSLHPHQSPLAQAVVADFMAEGHFARHVKRMRLLYAERRAALIEALTDVVDGKRIGRVEAGAGGMHVLMRLGGGADDVDLVRRARADSLGPSALTPLAVEAACGPGLLLSFTNLPAETARREVDRLRRVMAAAGRASACDTDGSARRSPPRE
jgi:GntR family transcriptional regulator/MocR family aminotransferase